MKKENSKLQLERSSSSDSESDDKKQSQANNAPAFNPSQTNMVSLFFLMISISINLNADGVNAELSIFSHDA